MATSSNCEFIPNSDNGIDYEKIPLHALNISCRKILSNALIIERPLPTESGITRDWQGLCELAGVPYYMTKLFIRKTNPVLEFIDYWGDQLNPSFQHLINYLELMERFDILQDIQPYLEKDALAYLRIQEHENKFTATRRPIQDSLVTSGDYYPPPITIGEAEKMELGTYDGPEKFDAYVSYVESDSKFVATMVMELEATYKLKLYVKDRDMLLGVIESEADLEMINERCSKILLVVSEESINDPRCEFQAIIAQGSSLENSMRSRKVIPVMCKPCILPQRFKMLARLDYTKRELFGNFWGRLAISVRSSTMEGFATSRSGSPYSQLLPLTRRTGSDCGSNSSINECSNSSPSRRSSAELNLPSTSEFNFDNSSVQQRNSLTPNILVGKRIRPSTPELVSIELNSIQAPAPESLSPPTQPSKKSGSLKSPNSTKKKIAGFFKGNSS